MANSARRLRFPNPNLVESESTYLTADYSTGTSLTVAYNAVFSDNDFIVIGVPGNEKTEAIDVSGSVGAVTLTISAALSFSHPSGTPVFRSEFNRIEVSGNTGSGWSVLDTIDIQWDKQETLFIHQGGNDSYSYRFRLFNSASNNYSEYSPTIAGSGFAKNQLGFRVAKIRKEINDPNGDLIKTEKLIDLYDEAKDIIVAMRNDWYFWRKTDEGTITTVDGTRKYNLDDISTSIEYVDDVRYRDASDSTVEIYPLTYRPQSDFDKLVTDETNSEEDDSLSDYTIEDPDTNSESGYLTVYPLPETDNVGSFYIRYYQPDTDYDDVSDTINIPIPSVLDHYVLAYCYAVKGDKDRAEKEEDLFYGPTDFNKRRQRPTGIALLERLQVNKEQPSSYPRVIKRFKGRAYYQETTGNPRSSSAWDDYKEKYF